MAVQPGNRSAGQGEQQYGFGAVGNPDASDFGAGQPKSLASRSFTLCGMVEQASLFPRLFAWSAAVSVMPTVATAACHPPMPSSCRGTQTLAAPLISSQAAGLAFGTKSIPPPGARRTKSGNGSTPINCADWYSLMFQGGVPK